MAAGELPARSYSSKGDPHSPRILPRVPHRDATEVRRRLPLPYVVAHAYLSAGFNFVTEEGLVAFLRGFQEIHVLEMAELWALKPALQLLLLERIDAGHGNFRRISAGIAHQLAGCRRVPVEGIVRVGEHRRRDSLARPRRQLFPDGLRQPRLLPRPLLLNSRIILKSPKQKWPRRPIALASVGWRSRGSDMSAIGCWITGLQPPERIGYRAPFERVCSI